MQASSESPPRSATSRSTSRWTAGETVAQFKKIRPRALVNSESPSGAKIEYIAASSVTTVTTTSASSAYTSERRAHLSAGFRGHVRQPTRAARRKGPRPDTRRRAGAARYLPPFARCRQSRSSRERYCSGRPRLPCSASQKAPVGTPHNFETGDFSLCPVGGTTSLYLRRF